VQRKHAIAQGPITARIRRQGAMPTPDEVAEHGQEQEAAATAPETNSSATPMTFQERIPRERTGQTSEHTPE
jgi:hypothetical protein